MGRLFSVVLFFLVMHLGNVTSANTTEPTPVSVLKQLFETPAPGNIRFAPNFLTQVPAEEVTRIVTRLVSAHGQLQGVEADGDSYRLRFGSAEVPARIYLDSKARIAGLWFGAPFASGPLSQHVAAITELPGKVSLLVLDAGVPIVSHDAEMPLAVGSGMKLAVLEALARAVRSGERRWSDVVAIRDIWKSLPSGMLQDWPNGASVTLETLAHLMMSISDNTATDALIHVLGSKAIERISPRNTPFLTTRAFFTLKSRENGALRASWANGGIEDRRRILERIAEQPLPSAGALTTEPTFDEVEWFMSATELCAVLNAVSDLPSGKINPGPLPTGPWRTFTYKGGSETGVLNLSSRVVGADGRARCVVATWNHPAPLDENRLLAPYRGLLAAMAEEAR